MMKHRRQSNGRIFGPWSIGSSFKKRKGRFQSTRMKKIAAQVKRNQASWRLVTRNGDNANGRGNNVVNKANMHCSRTLESKKVNEKDPQIFVVVARQKNPLKSRVFLSKDLEMDAHSFPNGRSASKSNIPSTPPNILKQLTTSKLNNHSAPLAKKTKRVVSSSNGDKTTSGYTQRSRLLKETKGLVRKEHNKEKKGLVHKECNNEWSNSQASRLKAMPMLIHKEKNMETLNQHKNVLDSRSKGETILVEGEDINVGKHKLSGLNSLNDKGWPSTPKESNVSLEKELLFPNKEPSNDKSIHDEVMDEKDMEIQGISNDVASKEGTFSFNDEHYEQGDFFKAKGIQIMREAPRRLEDTHIFDKPRDTVECNGDPFVGCIQLDGTIPNTRFVEDGRNDVKLTRKRTEAVLEEHPKAHVGFDSEDAEKSSPNIPNTRLVEDARDDVKLKRKRTEAVSKEHPKAHVGFDSEDAENSSPMNKRRRYKHIDHRLKVSLPFVSESGKEKLYNYSQPIDEPNWSGIFKLDNKEYVSAAAHLSTKSCERVWTLSKSIPPVVALTRLSRLEVWPKSWEASRPTGDSIGLYFFPHKTGSQDLDQLVKETMENNTVFRAVVGDALMLIFPSNLLPEPYQTFQSRHYLWGVFKNRAGMATRVEEHHSSHHQAESQRADSDDETLLERAMRLKTQPPMTSTHCVGKERAGNPSSAIPNAPCPAEHDAATDTTTAEVTAAPTAPAAAATDQGQSQSSSRVPQGRMLAFVIRQKTPKLEKLIQEMDREGVLVFAGRGEMIGPGPPGFGSATAAAP